MSYKDISKVQKMFNIECEVQTEMSNTVYP
jgi:hypothetical protein